MVEIFDIYEIVAIVGNSGLWDFEVVSFWDFEVPTLRGPEVPAVEGSGVSIFRYVEIPTFWDFAISRF